MFDAGDSRAMVLINTIVNCLPILYEQIEALRYTPDTHQYERIRRIYNDAYASLRFADPGMTDKQEAELRASIEEEG